MNHIVGLSGGKDSTALALRLRELHPEVEYTYLCTPVGNELPDMLAHWRRLEEMLGAPLIRLQVFPGDGLLTRIRQYNALPSHRQRWCTVEMKIVPTIAFLREHSPCVQYVGLRADEEERAGIYGDIPGVSQSYPLREWGWGAEDVWRYLAERGVSVPKRTDCAWCYGQRIIEWKRLWQEHPELYEQAVQLEAETGHTFRSPSRDTWPAGLAALREEFARGRVVRGERKALEMYEDAQESCRVCRL